MKSDGTVRDCEDLKYYKKQNFNIETIKGDLKIELIKSDNVNKQV